IFFVIFILISLVHFIAIVIKKENIRRISKCLVMPLLLAVYLSGGGGSYILPAAALVLGWIGDVLLIKIEKKTHFMLGLASFLLGHVFYIIAFLRIIISFGGMGLIGNINIPAMLIFIPPTIVLTFIVFALIKPTREMFFPVIAYMVVLVAMSLVGFQVFLLYPGVPGLLILSGCFNFMVSDTILAYYTFRKLRLPGAVLIMVYYILAQAEIIFALMMIKGLF
ncbi:MAG: lysoplasmalogenase, partial [Treponema sp.]|nr:lysoplasmalogenase [Treponema sp.]